MKRRSTRRFGRRGISLVEVMVVIAIVLSLMSILAIGVFRAWEEARVQLTWLTMGKVSEEVFRHELRHHEVPRELHHVYEDQKPPDDGWGRPFVLTTSDREWDLLSYGRDGEEGGSGYAEDLRWSQHPD